jgi:hypothetical protein
MAKDKKPPIIGKKVSSTGDIKRKNRTIMASDSEWDAITAEARRQGMVDTSAYIRDCCKNQAGAVAGSVPPPADEDNIPEGLKREALIAIIHLHSLFGETWEKGGKGALFEELREKVKERLRRSGLPD